MHMTHRFGATLALAWIVTASSQTVDGPPVPYEDFGGCPFEGCTYRDWRARSPVEIHAERLRDSAVVFRVAKGEKIRALGGVVVTIKAGRVQFDEARRLDTSAGPINILPGQTLFLLTYQGEGFTKAWFNRRVYTGVDVSSITRADGQCGFTDPKRCSGREVEKSQTEWWVQVRNSSGLTGWTLEPDKFDDKDLFGKNWD